MRMLRENPLLHYHLLGATRHRWRRQPWLYGTAVVGIALVYILALQVAVQGGEGVEVPLGLSLFVMGIAAPLMAYNLFSSEYEKQTWESLALTRLTALEIFWGKWGVALVRVALTTVLFAPSFLFSGEENPYTIGAAFALLFGWGTLLASVGVWLSFKLKRTLTTAAALYAGQVFVLMLLPSLVFVFGGRMWEYNLSDTIRLVTSVHEAVSVWLLSLTDGTIILYAHPFYTASELSWLSEPRSWWWQSEDHWRYMRGLYAMGWGFTQSALYLAVAALFAGLTYRGLKISWRK